MAAALTGISINFFFPICQVQNEKPLSKWQRLFYGYKICWGMTCTGQVSHSYRNYTFSPEIVKPRSVLRQLSPCHNVIVLIVSRPRVCPAVGARVLPVPRPEGIAPRRGRVGRHHVTVRADYNNIHLFHRLHPL